MSARTRPSDVVAARSLCAAIAWHVITDTAARDGDVGLSCRMLPPFGAERMALPCSGTEP
eukprot:1107760-Rhodomonas_salina.3